MIRRKPFSVLKAVTDHRHFEYVYSAHDFPDLSVQINIKRHSNQKQSQQFYAPTVRNKISYSESNGNKLPTDKQPTVNLDAKNASAQALYFFWTVHFSHRLCRIHCPIHFSNADFVLGCAGCQLQKWDRVVRLETH